MASSKIQWHPSAHAQLGSVQLVFWRLRFNDSYFHEGLMGAIDAICARQGVRSRVIYEVLGHYDLLVRCWLPHGHDRMRTEAKPWFRAVERMKLDITATFPAYDQHVTCDYFVVETVRRHWWWDVGNDTGRSPPTLAPEILDQYDERDIHEVRGLIDEYNAPDPRLSLAEIRSHPVLRQLERDGVWRARQLYDGIKVRDGRQATPASQST